MKKKWLHTIRREEGKYFKVTKSTRVRQRHFREGDIKKTLSGKNELKDGVVPRLCFSHEAYLTEIIDNNNKRIYELEQEIDELKRQLQDTQWRNNALNKRLFSFENLKSKDSNAAFYSGFQTWDAFMAVFEYLDPGERGENISFWRSSTDITSDYSEDQTDELLTKKGRARSLKPLDEFFMVMCRLRQGFPEDHLANLFNVSTPTVSRIFIT
ncbi:unnamed protein product [Porites lobata]|uniref:Transposase Helix-turn-helix domain-containing protein n=1 Tax=Porites lobata TaxID=104759 RepID=A0ABN8PFA7_9CNID|nr:unnamed protein product [Porites lobata]